VVKKENSVRSICFRL